jgi:hypothetical protein
VVLPTPPLELATRIVFIGASMNIPHEYAQSA